jgi:hypothetical protein
VTQPIAKKPKSPAWAAKKPSVSKRKSPPARKPATINLADSDELDDEDEEDEVEQADGEESTEPARRQPRRSTASAVSYVDKVR